MYGFGDYEVILQRQQEIRQEVAANGLGRMARANRATQPGLVRNLGWELERYAGLLSKRLSNLK